MNTMLSTVGLLLLLLSPSYGEDWPGDDWPLHDWPDGRVDAPLLATVNHPAATAPGVITTASVKVKIKGPTVGIIGDKIYMSLEETGSVANRVWSVYPSDTIGLDIRQRGALADFSTRFPGTYVFFVSVAGPTGSIAQAHHVVEMRNDVDPPRTVTAKSTDKTPASGAPKAKSQAPVEPAPTAGELVRQWTDEVKSNNRRAEALILAGTLRQIAGGIDSGTLTGKDLWGNTHGSCVLALGNRAGLWEPWLKHIDELFAEAERQKTLQGPGHYAQTMRNIAKILEQSQ